MSKTIITNPSRRYQKLLDLAREGAHPYVYLLGLRSYRTPELLEKIGDGLSFAAFKRLQRHMGLPSQELARIVQIHERTLARRRQAGRLEPDESDRLVRVSRIFAMALQLHEGDYPAAREWLAGEQVGLGGSRPLDLAGSEVGAREVEALIGRLEHGVFP